MKTQWTESMTLGIAGVDEDHRLFLARVKDLDAAIANHLDRSELERRMHVLIRETTTHFDHEQRLLAERRYPFADRHIALHAELKSKLMEAQSLFFMAEKDSERMKHCEAIKQLLLDHFNVEDMRYAEFLRKQRGGRRT